MSHFSLLVIGDDPEGQLDQFYDEKWDWYAIGGRWAGSLKLKPEYAHCGEPREEAWNSPEVLPGWCDQAYKNQIDFTSMIPAYTEESAQEFERIQVAIIGLQNPLSFNELQSLNPTLSRAQLVTMFWHQSFCKAIQDLYPDSIFLDPMKFVGIEKDRFIRTSVLQRIFPFFAVLNNGEWLEQGSMGSFGRTDDHCTEHEWHDLLQKVMQEADDESLLTVIDCHW